MKTLGVRSNRSSVNAMFSLAAVVLSASVLGHGLFKTGRAEHADSGQTSRQNAQVLVDSHDDSQILLKDLLGTPVMAADGETIGEVEDLILTRDGNPMAVVVAIGGLWGMGGKAVAVPWSRLVSYAHDEQVKILALDVKAEALEAAPAFSRFLPPQGRTRVRMQTRPQVQ